MRPHAVAPPRCSFAITGPSTSSVPDTTAFTNPNWRTIVQSHVRETNSRHPSASSAMKLRPSIRSVEGRCIAPVRAAETKNETASIAIPVPGLVSPTTSPAIAAPPIRVAFTPSRRRAFALCKASGGTVCGTIPVEAGKKNAKLAPPSAESTMSCQISALPLSSSAAVTACTEPLTTLEATITRWRGSRSAQIPPTSMKITSGIACAART